MSNTNYFAMIDDENEFEMWQGLRGPYFQPHVAEDGTLTWTNNGGLTNPDPITIEGHDGAPGFSPTVEIQTIQGGHRVIITDEDGPHSFDVIDYMEGRAIQSTVLNADYTLTIRYTDGTSYTTPSIRGATGATGPAGTDGTDGVSPDVAITSITGGHRVTITDADHPQGQSFDVMDGTSQGGLPAGGSTMDFLAKSSNTDYDARWVSLYSSSTPAMDGTGSAGITSTFSRSDHVHPSDTSRQAKITASGLLKGDGSGGVSAAAAGTDYQAPEAKIAITLSASWTGSGPYTQTVTVSGGTASSIISLQPSIAQSAQLIQDGVQVLQIDNNNGTFTATAFGAAPSSALTLQATRREVAT